MYHCFRSLMNFIVTNNFHTFQKRNNAGTIQVDYHCFRCWNVFAIASEKKIFMQKEAFFFATTLKLKHPKLGSLLRINSMAKQLIRNQNSSSRKSVNE